MTQINLTWDQVRERVQNADASLFQGRSILAISRGGIIPSHMAVGFHGPIKQLKVIDPFTDISEFKNEKITLVDDIYDTGATMEYFKKQLKDVKVFTVIDRKVDSCTLTNSPTWYIFPWETSKDTVGGVEQAIMSIFRSIGENTNRVGLQDTPKRVAKMFKESFRGYDDKQVPRVTTFPNGQDGIKYDQIITDSGYFYSHCEHHMVPFFGTYYFGYIPNKKIIGLSKVARVVDHFSAKLQVQERLGHEIVEYISNLINPEGVILQLKARHLCKEMRGAKKVNGEMTTSIVRGVFKKDLGAREEFYHLIK